MLFYLRLQPKEIFQVWDSHRDILSSQQKVPSQDYKIHGCLTAKSYRQMKDKKSVKTGNNAGCERERVSEHNEQQVLCGQSAGKVLRFGSDVGWMMELMDETSCLCYSPPPSFPPHHPSLFHT